MIRTTPNHLESIRNGYQMPKENFRDLQNNCFVNIESVRQRFTRGHFFVTQSVSIQYETYGGPNELAEVPFYSKLNLLSIFITEKVEQKSGDLWKINSENVVFQTESPSLEKSENQLRDSQPTEIDEWGTYTSVWISRSQNDQREEFWRPGRKVIRLLLKVEKSNVFGLTCNARIKSDDHWQRN
jgi:hypothetical protein